MFCFGLLRGTVEVTRGGKAEEPQLIGDILEYQMGKIYPIKLVLDGNGGIATLGNHSVPMILKAPGKVNVSVICSGGEFLFTDLQLGGDCAGCIRMCSAVRLTLHAA